MKALIEALSKLGCWVKLVVVHLRIGAPISPLYSSGDLVAKAEKLMK